MRGKAYNLTNHKLGERLHVGRRLALSLMGLLPPNLGKKRASKTVHKVKAVVAEDDESEGSNHQQSSLLPLPIASGPFITNVSVIDDGTLVELTVTHGRGMHWAGTKQCTRCCGESGWQQNGRGLTNSYIMEMLLGYGTWMYITPHSVTFPDVNTTGLKIRIAVPSPLNPHHEPYCPALALRYAWEDFPECAIYNADGLPLPPFNITLGQGGSGREFTGVYLNNNGVSTEEFGAEGGIVAGGLETFHNNIDPPVVSVVATSQPAAMRIMPLGDSITQWNCGHIKRVPDDGATASFGGYRGFLFSQLAQLWGKPSYLSKPFETVGGMYDCGSHEGHSGWTCADLDSIITASATAYRPDVVLLMCGTNDLYYRPSTLHPERGGNVTTVLARMNSLLNKLFAVQPNVQVLISTISDINATKCLSYGAGACPPSMPADIEAVNIAMQAVRAF